MSPSSSGVMSVNESWCAPGVEQDHPRYGCRQQPLDAPTLVSPYEAGLGTTAGRTLGGVHVATWRLGNDSRLLLDMQVAGEREDFLGKRSLRWSARPHHVGPRQYDETGVTPWGRANLAHLRAWRGGLEVRAAAAVRRSSIVLRSPSIFASSVPEKAGRCSPPLPSTVMSRLP
jgi:hypothetical protein